MKSHFAILLGSILVSFLLYGKGITGEFVSDDYLFSKRPQLRSLAHLPKIWIEPYVPSNPEAGLYRPLVTTSFSLNFVLFGESPTSFHITNILFHGLACYLVYLISLSFSKNSILSLIIGSIFLLMPIHSEPVLYIKARDELLSTIFTLAGWLTFIKATEKKISTKVLFVSSFFYLLALLSKELAFANIGIWFGHYYLTHKPKFAKLTKLTLVFLPAVIVYLALRLNAMGEFAFVFPRVPYDFNPLQHESIHVRILTGLWVLWTYIYKSLTGIGLSATYHIHHLPVVKSLFTHPTIYLGLGVVIALIYLLLSKRIKSIHIKSSAIAFLIPYSIISQFFYPYADVMGERWIYLPSVGICMLLGYVFFHITRRSKPVGTACLIVVLTWYAYASYGRIPSWSNPEAHWLSMTKDAPKSVGGYAHLSEYYYFEQRDDTKAYEFAHQAIKIYPDNQVSLDILGFIEAKRGNIPLAEEYFRRSISSYSTSPRAVLGLAAIKFSQKKYTEALSIYEMAIRNSQDPAKPSPDRLIPYAATLTKLGRYNDSLEALAKLDSDSAANPYSIFIKAVNLYKLGLVDEAVTIYAGNTEDLKKF